MAVLNRIVRGHNLSAPLRRKAKNAAIIVLKGRKNKLPIAMNKKIKNTAGGIAISSIPGYMSLLSQWSHRTIKKKAYLEQKAKLLAKYHRNVKSR